MIWYFPERIFDKPWGFLSTIQTITECYKCCEFSNLLNWENPVSKGNWCPATAGDINQAQIVTEPVVSAS